MYAKIYTVTHCIIIMINVKHSNCKAVKSTHPLPEKLMSSLTLKFTLRQIKSQLSNSQHL